ncbi:hypothetical protein BH741_12860 [Enterococcus faecium]|nr:hypothetical protein BH741_12860 [Enterococcus faecium]
MVVKAWIFHILKNSIDCSSLFFTRDILLEPEKGIPNEANCTKNIAKVYEVPYRPKFFGVKIRATYGVVIIGPSKNNN